MQVELTIKNYRCFADSKPARIEIQDGFTVTALVGVNNSGKSSLLRLFFELRQLFKMLSHNSGQLLNALRGIDEELPFPPSVLDHDEVFCDANKRDVQLRLDFRPGDMPTGDAAVPFPPRFDVTIARATKRWHSTIYLDGHPVDMKGRSLEYEGDTVLIDRTGLRVDLSVLFATFAAFTSALYIGPFRNVVNIGGKEGYKEDYYDMKVGQPFIDTWSNLKSGNIKRYNDVASRVTEDIRRILGLESLEISPSHDKQTLQINMNGRPYKLHELGSGLAQFILVLASAATKSPSYILIDEPESNLHPSLQLDFLTTLASYATNGIVFATHSVGLARAAADRVYSLRKNSDGYTEVHEFEATPKLSEFLGELSFSSYQELGFNKILLVEGSTELKTVQQLLRQHKKDHEVVLLHLGGGELICESREVELAEIKRISSNVFALIDSERRSANAPLDRRRQEFVNTCDSLGIKRHVLERRAIENYFSDSAIKTAKTDKHRSLEPYESLACVSPNWSKRENWRIAREMTKEDLEGTDLGEFFESHSSSLLVQDYSTVERVKQVLVAEATDS